MEPFSNFKPEKTMDFSFSFPPGLVEYPQVPLHAELELNPEIEEWQMLHHDNSDYYFGSTTLKRFPSENFENEFQDQLNSVPENNAIFRNSQTLKPEEKHQKIYSESSFYPPSLNVDSSNSKNGIPIPKQRHDNMADYPYLRHDSLGDSLSWMSDESSEFSWDNIVAEKFLNQMNELENLEAIKRKRHQSKKNTKSSRNNEQSMENYNFDEDVQGSFEETESLDGTGRSKLPYRPKWTETEKDNLINLAEQLKNSGCFTLRGLAALYAEKYPTRSAPGVLRFAFRLVKQGLIVVPEKNQNSKGNSPWTSYTFSAF